MKTFFFFGEHLGLCPWFLAWASSIPVLGLESVCPRKGCPWPWPRIFFCPWPWPWPRALCPRLHLCYLHYFLANCDCKNPISDLVGHLTTACKQAMLHNCLRRLRAVATFRELSMTSNFGCFASLRVASRPV